MSWQWARTAAARLRDDWVLLVSATTAASLAWVLAHSVIGHPQPFFAPAAALIVLGQARGQRLLRAVEVVLGVAGGVLVADITAEALGPRNVWTIVVIILVTMGVAVAIGASTIFLVQAAVTALYVAVITPASNGVVPLRFVDALVGGGVAVVATQVARPRNPLLPVASDVHRVLDEVASVVEETATALDGGDEPGARDALSHARRVDDTVDSLRSELPAAREALWVDVHRRRRLGRVVTVEDATAQLDFLVRNTRVLARAGVTISRQHRPIPHQLVTGLRSFATATRTMSAAMTARIFGEADRADELRDEAQAQVVEAMRGGRDALRVPITGDGALPIAIAVGQLRSCALDLLRAGGVDDLDSLTLVDEALGMPAV